MRLLTTFVLACAFAAAPALVPAAASAGSFPPAAGCLANTLTAGDDVASAQISLPDPIAFGGTYSTVSVSTDGLIGLGGAPFADGYALATDIGTLSSDAGMPLIAPFAVDADSSARASVHWGTTTFRGRPALCVAWGDPQGGLQGYGLPSQDGDTFQALLVDRTDLGAGDYDVVFQYDHLTWDTPDYGSASVKAVPGIAGIAAGRNSFQLPGSAVSGALVDGGADALVQQHLGTATPGQDLLRIRGGAFSAGSLADDGVGHLYPLSSGTSGWLNGGVGAADLTGDGVPDLVSLDGYAGRVDVRAGTGDGAFGPVLGWTATSAVPVGPAFADFDGNGTTDVAVAGSYVAAGFPAPAVQVLLNDGHGNLTAHTLASAPAAKAVAAGDLNGDGHPDIVVGFDSSVGVLLGNGDGTFSAMQTYPTGTSAGGQGANTASLQLVDVNGDGRLDAVLSGHTAAILPGDGAGGFGTPQVLQDVRPNAATPLSVGLAVGDLNGDGRPDIAAVETTSSSTVAVWLQRSDGTFGTPSHYGAGMTHGSAGIAIGDLDGDGIPDLVLADPSLEALRGLGDGAFGPVQHLGDASASAVRLVDLNGDGRPDYVLADGGVSGDYLDTSDTRTPVLSLADVTAVATSPDGAAVSYSATATDPVDGAIAPSCAPASGSTFPVGDTTVWCSALDARGNETDGSFVVHVVGAAPTLGALPAVGTVEGNARGGATVTYALPTATDPADPSPTVACAPASGSLYPVGTTTVTCTATDRYGATATGTFAVTVVDTTAPALHVPSAQTVDATSPSGADVAFSATATDVVDGAPIVACTPASGSRFAIGDTVVRCTATDASGNVASASFTVDVRGAAAQLDAVLKEATKLALQRGNAPLAPVVVQLGLARAAIGTKAPKLTCIPLALALKDLKGAAGRPLDAADRTALETDVSRIEDVVGC